MCRFKDINEKWLKWSKILVIFVLILLAISIGFRTHDNKVYKEQTEFLLNSNLSDDMRKALANVSFTNNSRVIFIRDDKLILQNKFSCDSEFLMEDFFFNPRNGNITIYGLREDENRAFVFNFKLLPSGEKFQSKIYFDGREYDINYNDIDIKKDHDPIFVILDYNDDGVFDIDLYNSFQDRFPDDRPIEEVDEE